MRVSRVVFGLSLLAAGFLGCSEPDVVVSPTTTTTARRAASTSTTLRPNVPEPAAIPEARRQRPARMRERAPRQPRVRRQEVRAQLAEVLAKKRPDRPLSEGDLERLTNKVMQIRVMKARIARLRPEAQQTPRAAAMRGRLDVLIDEFQTLAGVHIRDLGTLLDVPTAPPRMPPAARPAP
jgi:hypothetical protein